MIKVTFVGDAQGEFNFPSGPKQYEVTNVAWYMDNYSPAESIVSVREVK